MDTKEGIYGVAMAAVRMCNAITNVAGQFRDNPQTRQVLMEMDRVRAQLQVSFGNSKEVIVGADLLSQIRKFDKSEYEKDILTLQDALKREDLSNEAKETLERAIRDIKNKLNQLEIMLKKSL